MFIMCLFVCLLTICRHLLFFVDVWFDSHPCLYTNLIHLQAYIYVCVDTYIDTYKYIVEIEAYLCSFVCAYTWGVGEWALQNPWGPGSKLWTLNHVTYYGYIPRKEVPLIRPRSTCVDWITRVWDTMGPVAWVLHLSRLRADVADELLGSRELFQTCPFYG